MNAVVQLHSHRPDYRMARMAANARGILNEPHLHQPQTVIEAGQFYLTDVQEWERQQAQRKIEEAQKRQASETWCMGQQPVQRRSAWQSVGFWLFAVLVIWFIGTDPMGIVINEALP